MRPILSTYVQVEGFMAEVTKHLTLEGGGEKHRFPRLAQDIEFIAVSFGKAQDTEFVEVQGQP